MLLMQSIKEDLNLSDSQLGLLTGIAFALFYATAGVPIARWADRGNRVTIASLAIGLWGLTVMACLLVGQYVHLLLARIAAAVGESGCKPPTYSLVGDYFPLPAERTRALTVYFAGNSLAALVSFIVGGWLNELFGWRMTFFIMGAAGLALAILVKLTVVEPRLRVPAPLATPRAHPPLKAVLALVWRRKSARHLGFALILLYLMGSGMGPWYATFMIRTHGMNTVELGVWLGVILGLSGASGILFGGYMTSRWLTGMERMQMRMTALTVIGVIPFFIAFLTLPGKYQALLMLIPLMIIYGLFLGPIFALLQRLVADDMRATVLAIVMLLANLIGLGLGPLIVGMLSDVLAPSVGADALRYAMLAMSFVGLWSGFHFWRAGHTVQQDLAVGVS